MEPVKVSRQDAIARGLHKFYTAEPCKRGHYSERYTKNGACIACLRVDLPKRNGAVIASNVFLPKTFFVIDNIPAGIVLTPELLEAAYNYVKRAGWFNVALERVLAEGYEGYLDPLPLREMLEHQAILERNQRAREGLVIRRPESATAESVKLKSKPEPLTPEQWDMLVNPKKYS